MQPLMRRRLPLLLQLLALTAAPVEPASFVRMSAAAAGSSPPQAPPPPRTTSTVSILTGGGGPEQSLPSGYVASLPHFVAAPKNQYVEIPCDDGFVNPHNFDELWLPDSLRPAPTMTLSLCALLKDGQLRCVFPGVDGCVARRGCGGGGGGGGSGGGGDDDDHDNNDGTTAASEEWRNWGLASVPLASSFLDYMMIPLDQLTLSMSAGSAAAAAAGGKQGGGVIDPAAWVPLHENLDVMAALDRLFLCMSDPPPAMLERSGFQLLTIPVPGGELPPRSGSSSSSSSSDSDSNGSGSGAGADEYPFADGTVLRLFLNDYPEPRRLLELKQGESSGGAAAEWTVRHVASGADSAYLPEAYRPLFGVQ